MSAPATFTLTVLGSGTCSVTPQRSMAAYHLQVGEHALLLDVGAGAIRRMLEAGIDHRRINEILITHLHIDHIADLVPLLWASRYAPGEAARQLPLRIIGPPGICEWYANLARAHGEWMLNLPFRMVVEEKAQAQWKWRDCRIETLPMYHSVPVNGYRLTRQGRVFVFTGDTGYGENVVRLARKADLLLIECSFPQRDDEEMDTHLMPATVGQIASESRARSVLLTHMYPECDAVDLIAQCRNYFDGTIERAEDLKRYAL